MFFTIFYNSIVTQRNPLRLQKMQTNDSHLEKLFLRINAANQELSHLTETNSLLQEQCTIQQTEVSLLQKDKLNTQNELKEIFGKVEELMQQKVKLESRLNALKMNPRE